jgi:hypothetical protein
VTPTITYFEEKIHPWNEVFVFFYMKIQNLRLKITKKEFDLRILLFMQNCMNDLQFLNITVPYFAFSAHIWENPRINRQTMGSKFFPL